MMPGNLEWVQRLIVAGEKIIPKDFHGKVEINARGGKISNVNITQSIKGGDGR
jgi:hypothetical protein